jgi:hypothetical protein
MWSILKSKGKFQMTFEFKLNPIHNLPMKGGSMATVNPIQVQKFLGGMNYPANKDEIVKHAKSKGADDKIMQTLEQLPEESFQTPADVSKAIGQID